MKHIEKLNWRYATKKFDETKKLSKEQLDNLVESLRLAASSFGLQPWKFMIISNEELKKELLPHSWNQEQVVNCSHHIVFCTYSNFNEEHVTNFVKTIADARGQSLEELKGYKDMMTGFLGRMDEKQVLEWAKNQVYLALGSFLVTCAELGIDACPMEGIVQSEYDRALKLSEKGLTTVVACPVGIRSEDDKYSELAKVRFPLKDVIEFVD